VSRSVRLRRFGAAGGVAILLVPMILLCTLTARSTLGFWLGLIVLVVFTTGAHRTEGPLVFHSGSHVIWDFGLPLAALPAAATIWLVAPFAAYRRRDALMILLPVWNLYVMAKICARVADAATVDLPHQVRSLQP
jgi:hypothetical protein